MSVQLDDAAADLDLARSIVDVAADHQAEDVVLLDIRPVAAFADFFVICTGTSQRQIRAIVEAIDETLSDRDQAPRAIEGTPESGWVLMDYGSVIVHFFSPETREFYRLERLWNEAVTILRLQ